MYSISMQMPGFVESARAAKLGDAVVFAQPPTARQIIYNVVGERNVAVPTAFFTVVVDDSGDGDPEVLAFLIRNYSKTGRNLKSLLASVDKIERLTGIDLLTKLDSEVEERVEKEAAKQLW